MTSVQPHIIQWIIDTRQLWNVSINIPLREQMYEFRQVANPALSLLPASESSVVLKYHHPKDARMSLASYLLKHLAITTLCSVTWSASHLSRGKNGKPCYVPPSATEKSISFNVSHQAGIVTLIACAGIDIDLGTDVVCVNERDDYGRIDAEGFFAFVDMHAEVFAPEEVQALKMDVQQLGLSPSLDLKGYGREAIARCQYGQPPVRWRDVLGVQHEIDAMVIIEKKLRRFYALWCLREAYVKMTGEALLADWLRDLEFRTFRTPMAISSLSSADSMELGEVVTSFEVWFKGKRVNDIEMELRAFGKDYMVASAARKSSNEPVGSNFKGFSEINLEMDILAIATQSSF